MSMNGFCRCRVASGVTNNKSMSMTRTRIIAIKTHLSLLSHCALRQQTDAGVQIQAHTIRDLMRLTDMTLEIENRSLEFTLGQQDTVCIRIWIFTVTQKRAFANAVKLGMIDTIHSTVLKTCK